MIKILHHEEVLSFRRIVKVGRVVDILKKTAHNGFPVILEEDHVVVKKYALKEELAQRSRSDQAPSSSSPSSSSGGVDTDKLGKKSKLKRQSTAPAARQAGGVHDLNNSSAPSFRTTRSHSAKASLTRLAFDDDDDGGGGEDSSPQFGGGAVRPFQDKNGRLTFEEHVFHHGEEPSRRKRPKGSSPHSNPSSNSRPHGNSCGFMDLTKGTYVEWDQESEGSHLVGFVLRKTLVQLLALRRFSKAPEFASRRLDQIAQYEEIEGNYPRY